jgi:hypothetical protein
MKTNSESREPAALAAWLKMVCLIAGLIAALSLTGCHSDLPVSSFASVQFHGCTPEQIRDATVAVFNESGYQAPMTAPVQMVFEKEGSNSDQWRYGGWSGDSSVWVRVRASIVSQTDGSLRLEAQAYMVRSKNQIGEEEQRVPHYHREPFQELLNKVSVRLKCP